MYQCAFCIQDDKHREAESLRMTQSGHYREVLVLLTVVKVVDDIIRFECGVYLRVTGTQFVKPGAPDTPIAAYLDKQVFMGRFCLYQGILNPCRGVLFRVIKVKGCQVLGLYCFLAGKPGE